MIYDFLLLLAAGLIIVALLSTVFAYELCSMKSSILLPNSIPQPKWLPSPTASPDTSSPKNKPKPTPPPEPVYPNITISYTGQMVLPSTDPYANFSAEVHMTITNNGYGEGFSTNPSYFILAAGNAGFANPVKFTYNVDATNGLDDWNTAIVSDGGTYNGTLVFRLTPDMKGAFAGLTLYGWYMGYGVNGFNIVWIPPGYFY